jgi:hypothetical protein
MRKLRTLLIVCFIALGLPLSSRVCMGQISFGFSIRIGPPALPVYAQPMCPAPGYIWTPGYWAWGAYGYYWVPGTWVLAPQPGFLWTPGYWGWSAGLYMWHPGYWGPHVGFYGGINYGFGYTGVGYGGGYWRGGNFYYNRSVNRINVVNIHNVYNRTVVNNVTVNHVSYNGGPGGVTARATATQMSYARERHLAPTQAQNQQMRTAQSTPSLRASVNHGRPAIAATARPGAFRGGGVVRAQSAGAPYRSAGNARGFTPRGQQQNRSRQGNFRSFSPNGGGRNANGQRQGNSRSFSPNGGARNANRPNSRNVRGGQQRGQRTSNRQQPNRQKNQQRSKPQGKQHGKPQGKQRQQSKHPQGQ